MNYNTNEDGDGEQDEDESDPFKVFMDRWITYIVVLAICACIMISVLIYRYLKAKTAPQRAEHMLTMANKCQDTDDVECQDNETECQDDLCDNVVALPGDRF
eukprot:193346_1